MILNLQEIMDKKLEEMITSGSLEKQLEAAVEKAISSTLVDTLGGYEMKKRLRESINVAVDDIGFAAYNSFFAEKMGTMLQNVLQHDAAEKLQEQFDRILVKRHESIKLSEIIKCYKTYLDETVDYEDKRDTDGCCTCVLEDDSICESRWYKLILSEKPDVAQADADIYINFHCDSKDSLLITSLRIDGHDAKSTFKIGYLSEPEALLTNLYWNKTPIIMDVQPFLLDEYYCNLEE